MKQPTLFKLSEPEFLYRDLLYLWMSVKLNPSLLCVFLTLLHLKT